MQWHLVCIACLYLYVKQRLGGNGSAKFVLSYRKCIKKSIFRLIFLSYLQMTQYDKVVLTVIYVRESCNIFLQNDELVKIIPSNAAMILTQTTFEICYAKVYNHLK